MDESRLTQIENELQRLNQRIDNLKSLLLGAQAASTTQQEATSSGPFQPLPPQVIVQSSSPSTTQVTASAIGKYASLGVVSVFFFLLAAAYALSLAYQSGYLTPRGILYLLSAVGVGLVGSGYISYTKDKKFQSFLPVTGILILNAVFYSATAVYGMMGSELGLMMTLGISVLGIFLYEEFKYDVYWIIAVLGAYFFPFLLKQDSDLTIWNSFLVVSSLGFALASVFVNKRPLSLMACVCAFVAVASRQNEYTDLTPIIFMALHLAIFLSGFVLFFRKSKKLLEQGEAFALFIMGVFFHIYSEILAQKSGLLVEITVAVLTMAIFFGLRMYVEALLEPEQREKSFATEALEALLFFMVSSLGYVIAVPEQWRALFVMAMLGLTVALLGKKLTSFRRLFSVVVGICLAGMFFYEYGSLIFFNNNEYKELKWIWMLVWGTIILLSEKRVSTLALLKDVSQKFWVAYYGLGHILLLKLLFLVTKEYGQSDFQVIFVSIYAGFFVFLGFKLKLKNLAKSALPILVFISSLLLLGLGVGDTSPIVRIFSFLGAGVAFWAAGFLLRKIDHIRTV